MTVIDLFCGCGGFSYGFQEAGFDVLLGIDNDAAALKTFSATHYNAQTLCTDITRVSEADVRNLLGDKQVDVVIGGPPCQGMSLSGPRSFNDPRNSLYLSFIRLVKELKPRAVVIENVPGLVSLYKGEIKNAVLEQFSVLGYKMAYKVLRASDFGVPQHRKRVFFVGLLDEFFQFPAQTHFEPGTLISPGNAHVTCEAALSDLPLLENGIGEVVQQYALPASNDYQELMRNGSSNIRNHVAAAHSDKVRDVIRLVPDGCNYKSLPEELRTTRNFHVAWTRFASTKPAPTIDTGHRHHFHYKADRVPTVRECARLQSFPDKFVFLGNKTEQFRQVGNAVPPLLAESIARQLRKYL